VSTAPVTEIDPSTLSFEDLKPYLTPEEQAELASLLAQDDRVFYPTPGPQMMAATTPADIIGYGGAAGGGKSYLICGLALSEHSRIVIFRQHKNQTRKFVQDFTKILGNADGYSSQNSEWKLPPLPGKKQERLVEFAGLEDPNDHQKWQGRDHDLYCFDEATQMREYDVRYTSGWNRTDDPAQRCRVLLTFNPPTTAEGRWVIKFFAPWLDRTHPNPAKDGELRWFTTIGGNQDYEVPDARPFVLADDGSFIYDFDPKSPELRNMPQKILTPKSRTFITARVKDNPYYMATGYIATLQGLPEPLRSQMLNGDFGAGMEDAANQVIPTAWVEEAQARWTALTTASDFRKGPMDSVGVDAARGGNMGGTAGAIGRDKMVIAPRHGRFFDKLTTIPGIDVNTGMLAASQILVIRRDQAPVHLDVVSIGTSVYDALGENKIHVVPINGQARSVGLDRSGTLRFANKRAEIHWRLREALDPNMHEEADLPALPPDPELLADLTAPRWHLSGQGIRIESKDEIKARIGRSPDKGEAVMYANVDTPKRMMHIGSLLGVPQQSGGSYEEQRLKELE
jgi:hypothetical protein